MRTLQKSVAFFHNRHLEHLSVLLESVALIVLLSNQLCLALLVCANNALASLSQILSSSSAAILFFLS